MKSKWIHRLLIKQQGAYHLVNLYTYWSKLSSQWLVNSSKASCSLRLLRGVPITNGESAKYSSLVWLFSTQIVPRSHFILWRQRFQAARFPPMEKLHLAGRQKSVHVVQNQFCHLLIHMPMQWTKLVGCNCRPLVRTCCMPCQLRSVPSNLSRANALKKRRAAPALWTLAKMHISFPELFVLIF